MQSRPDSRVWSAPIFLFSALPTQATALVQACFPLVSHLSWTHALKSWCLSHLSTLPRRLGTHILCIYSLQMWDGPLRVNITPLSVTSKESSEELNANLSLILTEFKLGFNQWNVSLKNQCKFLQILRLLLLDVQLREQQQQRRINQICLSFSMENTIC